MKSASIGSDKAECADVGLQKPLDVVAAPVSDQKPSDVVANSVSDQKPDVDAVPPSEQKPPDADVVSASGLRGRSVCWQPRQMSLVDCPPTVAL